jgi:hypothetical protein
MINIISSILHAFVLIYIQTQSAHIYPHSCSAKRTGQRQAWSRVAAVLWRKHAHVVCLYDFICATVAMFIQFMLCNCSHSYLLLCESLCLSTFYITPLPYGLSAANQCNFTFSNQARTAPPAALVALLAHESSSIRHTGARDDCGHGVAHDNDDNDNGGMCCTDLRLRLTSSLSESKTMFCGSSVTSLRGVERPVTRLKPL